LKFVSLMSGGIDSPVATDMILRRGWEACILNMENVPFSGPDESEKVEEIARRLSAIHPGRVRLFRASHGLVLSAVTERSNLRYTCILCKKAMLMTADSLCDEVGASIIVMGDSMGQVASQTLKNISAVSRNVRHPIVRPLIGLDKIEIEERAKSIGTFELSIRRTHGCTAAPRYPMTMAVSERLEEEASKAGLASIIEQVLVQTREIPLC
jgi:thiamine biosynthesis protein ThiI